jgi:hypothetical protein
VKLRHIPRCPIASGDRSNVNIYKFDYQNANDSLFSVYVRKSFARPLLQIAGVIEIHGEISKTRVNVSRAHFQVWPRQPKATKGGEK